MKPLLAASLSALLASQAAANVVFTEYVEGSSNNKALEISNLGQQTVDLSQQNYQLILYSNGSTSPSATQALTGTLAPRQSLVLYHANADSSFRTPGGLSSAVINFNGDDAIILKQGQQVVDSFGKLGQDPGSAWTSGSFSTKDRTLRLKSGITTGDTVTNDSFPGASHNWQSFAKNTHDGLGCPGEIACDELSAVLITEYVEGSSNNKALELTNIGDSTVDLTTDGYKIELYTNGSNSASQTQWLSGTLEAGKSLVVYNSSAANEFVFDAPAGLASTVTYFNGDDAIVFKKDNAVVDSIGRVGEDPGSAWKDINNSNFSTANKTLRRKLQIIQGDTNVTDPFPDNSQQWAVFAQDTADGLGCEGETACSDAGTGGDNGGEQVCVNCPAISKVADAALYAEADYYANALTAEPAGLRSAINGVISANQKQLTYSEVWSVLTYADEDPNNVNNVIEIYSGRSIAKFSNGSGAQASNPDAWNREHIWAKSHGFPDRSQMAYTDAHHLRPADISINATRSNFDFAEGGISLNEAPANRYDETLRTWEPRDEVKGDVARMMFYMDIRYEGATADNTPDLILVDRVGTENGTPEFGKLCTLYQWHLTDPVDAVERKRNNTIYEYQGNRNPFIDRPDWLNALYANNCSN